MSTVSLYDIIAREVRFGVGDDSELSTLGVDLVESLLGEWQRLREYERRFTPRFGADPAVVEEWDRSIWELHRDWSNEAIKLLLRLRPKGREAIPNLQELEDAYSRTEARLAVSPVELTRARADARAGNTIPTQVLRDELRARTHA